ncbi:MAG: valine--tRNA ligase [Omnitrophica WOR_2 bacterium RIFCSPHIGHO2_02_FULL_63_39]|nr:MAG: valine--tRNA ligase [Omnitrophica WOR_2 bacterium RIFCSPHIGHO2_02_FULL_63_39]OGX49149.1 MAG: valine--tRNA ligase [Omnitrophica WOR_2 bacterium RIFCSPLOWO2_12_FULL_63_16]
MKELPPKYNPRDVETRLYSQWEANGYFTARPDPTRTPYTIVIPPPNVTGRLHMGHALNHTIQDILIRWKRLQGANALWVPGTDHAGIATQNVVEKQLAKEGLRRQDLGREKFLERVWAWKEQYGNTIITQLKRLGASCDWSRTRFTMDEGLSHAVAEAFVKLYEQGLIYRGNYIINWCPRCQTALADEEAPRKETPGKLYYLRYPLVASGQWSVVSGERSSTSHQSPVTSHFIVVATTRPETMLGDTAVAVHPTDKRYKALIGQSVMLPLVNRQIPIIADQAIDPEFGTGAVKVTPAHDPVDFQLGKQHRLEFLNVMTDDGHMVNVPQPYQGLDRFECRARLLSDLEGHGLLEKVEEHLHAVGHCYRCNTVVEPRLSLQWFVKMKPLAKPAIEAVKKKQIVFTPARWTKVYLNWMDNIQDWCISRQIWWGHRLPVYYCHACQGQATSDKRQATRETPQGREPGVMVSKTTPIRCPACGSTDLKQDGDVLDTWFSSWLWPFSTLGWPQRTKDLGYFYPTDALVTAPEIIFFWVARMIMAGLFVMKDIPFRRVYIHGTVRDLTGKKMSKSLGNIIDPLEIIGQFGADALRYTLVTSTAVGTDVLISEEKFVVGRNFANKLWNAARFILQTCSEPPTHALPPRKALSLFDRAILDDLHVTTKQATVELERFRFNEAADQIYGFIWHRLCDWYIEFIKPTIRETPASQQVLRHAFEQSLRLLHPFMPFVTEELWVHVRPPDAPPSLMLASWPVDKGTRDLEAVEIVRTLTQITTAIRSIRAEFRIPPAVSVEAVVTLPAQRRDVLRETLEPQLKRLVNVGVLRVERAVPSAYGLVPFIFEGGKGGVALGASVEADRERARIERELTEDILPNLTHTQARLANGDFLRRAPKEVVAKEQGKMQRLLLRKETLESYRNVLVRSEGP